MRGEITGKTKAVIAATMKAALRKTFKAATRHKRGRRGEGAAALADHAAAGHAASGHATAVAALAGITAAVPQPLAPTGRAIDPVDLVALAVEKLGPASYRAAMMGVPVTVAVTDPEAAAVFRAALARSSRHSDRHIQVVVAGNG